MGAVGGSDPHSPGDGEDGGFQERLIPPRKTSVETQTMTDDSYYQRKITPRVPKRRVLFRIECLLICNFNLQAAKSLCIWPLEPVILEPDSGSSCTAKELLQSIVESEELALPPYAEKSFHYGWLLRFLVQLKPNQQPLGVRKNWKRLLHNYSSATHLEAESDDPRICLRRSAFLTKQEEMRITDSKILELFYAEARHNILSGRYPCEADDYSMLGALQAGIEMGTYNAEIHTFEFSGKTNVNFYLNMFVKQRGFHRFYQIAERTLQLTFCWKTFGGFRPTTPSRKLVRKYLELCWSLPYYGSAMFHGQVESPAKGLWSILDHPDNFVLVAINSHSLHVIDYYRNRILVGARFESLKVELGWPSNETNPNCLPCLFLQFSELESRQSKMLQIFSKQAPMMDALISRFHRARSRSHHGLESCDEVDGHGAMESADIDGDFFVSLKTVTQCGEENSCLSNKLSELALAAFDEEGICVSKAGSWAFAQ
ncbi:FERM domain-containing protein 8 [Orchesella cincta]|uniref:FERM domain-containing protein 8 n=1 Tax=Orchesella cincta TaxID=48709 RepID=A0A1D2NK31_ORCCI|nr:FERM domain-containing protein 8 [Orchesella cincta]